MIKGIIKPPMGLNVGGIKERIKKKKIRKDKGYEERYQPEEDVSSSPPEKSVVPDRSKDKEKGD